MKIEIPDNIFSTPGLNRSRALHVFFFLATKTDNTGKLRTSRALLSTAMKITEKQVRLALHKLQSNGFIEIDASRQGSIITLPESPEKKTLPKRVEKKTSDNILRMEFESFRKLYPGSKRSCDTEFSVIKKHHDHKEIIPQLSTIINNQISWRKEMSDAGMFVPDWQNLKTWLHQRSWEIEKPPIKTRITPESSEISDDPAYSPAKTFNKGDHNAGVPQ